MEIRRRSKPTTRIRRKLWYRSDPIGSEEELLSAFEVMEKYLYKLLDYSENDELIPQEELDKERRIFTFCMHGPKAGHFRLNPRGKLTSPDVLYILTTTIPSTALGQRYNIDPRKIRQIRSGQSEEWEWEYYFTQRIRALLKNRIKADPYQAHRTIWSLSKMVEVDGKPTKEILYYLPSRSKAKKLRQDIMTKKDFERLTKRNEIDILWPIEEISVLK